MKKQNKINLIITLILLAVTASAFTGPGSEITGHTEMSYGQMIFSLFNYRLDSAKVNTVYYTRNDTATYSAVRAGTADQKIRNIPNTPAKFFVKDDDTATNIVIHFQIGQVK